MSKHLIWLVLTMSLSTLSFADDGGWVSKDKRDYVAPDVRAVTNVRYSSTCGECHFAYQPGLLPMRSWQALIDHMPWHFGESLELEEGELKNLRRYLSLSSADRSGYRRSVKIAISVPDKDTPLRITELPHIIKEHGKGGVNLANAAEKMGGFGKCDSCHTRAVGGFYNEDEVVLPLEALAKEAH